MTSILFGVVAVFLVSRLILMDGYQRLEEQAVRQNVQRILNAVDEQLTAMQRTSADWAYADDTYEYLDDRYPDYVRINLSPSVLEQMHLSVVVLLDRNGRIVLQKAENLTTGEEMPLPAGLAEAIAPSNRLLKQQDPTGSISGLVMLKDGLMLSNLRAIVPTDEAGPPLGTLVLGRLLDSSEIAMLAERTQVKVSSHILGLDPLSQEDQVAESVPSQPAGSIFVYPLNDSQIAGYAVSNDLFGKPTVLWRAKMPRDISATGQASIRYLMLALLITAAAFTALMLVLVERFVLSPVSYLHRAVAQISLNGPAPTIALPNRDELGDLASAINQMVTELHQAQSSLKQSLQFKSDILANVSHDARSPVSTIKLRAEMLLLGVNGPLSPLQQQSIESIQSSADQLLAFVNNLLDASRLEAKGITLARQPLDPASLIGEVLGAMATQAAEKGIHLRAEVSGSVTSPIYGDPTRMTQILVNLIDNALKFTDQGEVTVTLAQPDEQHICIKVADTGIGITPEDQTRIFEAFYQTDRSMTRRQMQGVGLGLSIVKQLVDLMDGTIAVDSRLNVGTTFTLSLPLNAAGEPPP